MHGAGVSETNYNISHAAYKHFPPQACMELLHHAQRGRGGGITASCQGSSNSIAVSYILLYYCIHSIPNTLLIISRSPIIACMHCAMNVQGVWSMCMAQPMHSVQGIEVDPVQSPCFRNSFLRIFSALTSAVYACMHY